MAKAKFKVGDKVKILPSATDIGIAESEVGKVAEIICIEGPNSIRIKTATKRYMDWYVDENGITPAIKIEQQLLLWEE